MSETFYWHDYETSGILAADDRPMQFAGIRTDAELNICGDPLRLYCQLADDVLPHPGACNVTGIKPQTANELGLNEAAFIHRIREEMMQPNTCSVGYNSIRFDDEFTRHTLYRNLFDAYEREWRNGNSRWDLIDVVRLCCALRPDEIEWPRNEEGRVSFRLELLSAANGIEHEDAHDALSDVLATIELARILKQRKPRLYDYALTMRHKKTVAATLKLGSFEPVLHVSSKLPSEFYCTSLVLPVAPLPGNSNGVVCVDLREDPQALFDLSASDLARYLFMPGNQRSADDPEVPLKTIHLNKSPMVATPKLLDAVAIDRVQIDPALALERAAQLQKNPQWLDKLADIFAKPPETQADAERQLYGGGFFSDSDRSQMQQVHKMRAASLAGKEWSFDDPRLDELLFRYRARNFPNTLSEEERERWRLHCSARLNSDSYFGFVEFEQELKALREEGGDPELCDALGQHAAELRARL